MAYLVMLSKMQRNAHSLNATIQSIEGDLETRELRCEELTSVTWDIQSRNQSICGQLVAFRQKYCKRVRLIEQAFTIHEMVGTALGGKLSISSKCE